MDAPPVAAFACHGGSVTNHLNRKGRPFHCLRITDSTSVCGFTLELRPTSRGRHGPTLAGRHLERVGSKKPSYRHSSFSLELAETACAFAAAQLSCRFRRADLGASLRASHSPLATINAPPPSVHASGAACQNTQSNISAQASALYSKGAMAAAWP